MLKIRPNRHQINLRVYGHSSNLCKIFWKYLFTLNFSGMFCQSTQIYLGNLCNWIALQHIAFPTRSIPEFRRSTSIKAPDNSWPPLDSVCVLCWAFWSWSAVLYSSDVEKTHGFQSSFRFRFKPDKMPNHPKPFLNSNNISKDHLPASQYIIYSCIIHAIFWEKYHHIAV